MLFDKANSNEEILWFLSRIESLLMLKIIRTSTVPGSLNNFCRGVLRELSDKYEVIALSSPGNAMHEISEREGVHTICVPMERHIAVCKDVVSLFKLIRVFKNEKPTMVHSMTPKAGLLCMLAAKLARVPVRVHTFTGLIFPTSTGLKRKILMASDWLTCACATHIIPEGEGVKSDLYNNGITKKAIKVLGYGNVKGVDMDFYSQRPDVMRIVSQKGLRLQNVFTFLYVGRIVGDKGINELCNAFKKVHNQNPDSRLMLVGAYEEKLDPIKLETKALIEDIKSGIETVGSKSGEELLAYYASADCFVMPSYREGFPNTVLEAGAMGLPCIVTDINGSREIIREGENGMIVPPHDEELLYMAMKAMLESKVDRENMARNARKMIADRFEQGFVRKCLYDFYDEILAPYV